MVTSLVLALLACSSGNVAPTTAETVMWDARSVADVLAGHDERLDRLESARPPDVDAATVAALDERLSRVELVVLQGQATQADAARPTAGYQAGLDSRSAALSIEARLAKLEDKVLAVDMGEPGSALFDLPKTPGKGGKGGAPPRGAPGGGGPGGAPAGPPPGGGSGGGNGPPGPPPGGGGAGDKPPG